MDNKFKIYQKAPNILEILVFIATQTLATIAAIHYEGKKLQNNRYINPDVSDTYQQDNSILYH